MSEPRPAFLFYARDWLASRAPLSLQARACLVDLIAYAWHSEGLPTNEEELRRIAGASRPEWRRAWPEIEERFTLREGRLYNDWLEGVRAETSRYADGAKTLGQRGGKASAEARRRKYGNAQPRTQEKQEDTGEAEESPEAVRRSGSPEAVRRSGSPNDPKPASASASASANSTEWGLTTDTVTKAPLTPATGSPYAFLEWFKVQHREHIGKTYVITNQGKELGLLKHLSQELRADYPDDTARFKQMQRIATAMLTSEADWIDDGASRGIGLLVSCAQQWIDEAQDIEDEDQPPAWLPPTDRRGNFPPPAKKNPRTDVVVYPHLTSTGEFEFRPSRPEWWRDNVGVTVLDTELAAPGATTTPICGPEAERRNNGPQSGCF